MKAKTKTDKKDPKRNKMLSLHGANNESRFQNFDRKKSNDFVRNVVATSAPVSHIFF